MCGVESREDLLDGQYPRKKLHVKGAKLRNGFEQSEIYDHPIDFDFSRARAGLTSRTKFIEARGIQGIDRNRGLRVNHGIRRMNEIDIEFEESIGSIELMEFGRVS